MRGVTGMEVDTPADGIGCGIRSETVEGSARRNGAGTLRNRRRATPALVVATTVVALLFLGAVESIVRTNPWTGTNALVGGSASTETATIAPVTVVPEQLVAGLSGARTIDAAGDRVLVGDKSGGLALYAAEATAQARVTQPLRVQGEPIACDIEGSLITAACSWGGISLVERSGDALTLVSQFQTTSLARRAIIKDGYALVPDWNAGVAVVDVRKVASPKLATEVLTPGHASGLALMGDVAYLADFEGGVRMMDASKPERLTETTAFPLPAASSIAIDGKHAYVADEIRGLVILDLTAPLFPLQVGEYKMPGAAHSLDYDDGRLALGDLQGNLVVLDVSVPSRPVATHTMVGSGPIYDVDLRGKRVYFADGAALTAAVPVRAAAR